jgi:predicted DNA-binding protein (UPF0278 family)
MNIKTSIRSQESLMSGKRKGSIFKLIEECNNEPDIDKKIQLFYRINSVLPEKYQINIPSLITDDYIDTVLYRVQQNLWIDNAVVV